jgi:penicillin-binding protein 1C
MMRRHPAITAAGCIAASFLLLRLWPHQSLEQQIPLSTGVWSNDGELLRVTLASDDQYRLWTPINQISPVLAQVFIEKEDRWYYWHPGVNPISLVRAGFRTWRGNGRQGGSTLTMQLARLIYRLNTKTPTGKLRQMAAAMWLESRYSKRRLLEAYLNLAPFGGNVQGVGAASLIYFGKPASAINTGEAITLAVIPQHPALRAGKNLQEASLLKARSQLAAQWLDSHGASDSERRQLELPIVARTRYGMPQLAPHFVDALLAERRSAGGRVDTTLDAGLQRLIERQIHRYLDQFGERGIKNATALLVDTTDMSVKAWIGSADYGNDAIQGQVNGVLAKRSPGSTLKPFIYGLALDQGVLHPQTVLRDAPTAFGPFSPENFDGRFLGPISAQDALIRSRNVPAVWTAMQIRQPNLYQFLSSAGISRLKPESFYGLALALGGGEITMEELAKLYAMLANRGTLRPLRTTSASPSDGGIGLLSPEASFITLDMLNRNPRPDDDGSLPRRSRWPVAWKTGTSWGFRDAWAAGVAGRYVLVVWIGDFDGQGNPSFVGVDAAAPLFFRIVDALNLALPEDNPPERTPPSGVSSVAVCADSGDLPNAYCPHTVQTWYIPGKSPIRMSQLHRAVAIDNRTGRPVCSGSATPETSHVEVVEFWPSDMLKLFREAGMPRRTPPSLPDCTNNDANYANDAPRITSPLSRVTYALQPAALDVISLEANTTGDVREVFWFDGNELIGNGASQKSQAWKPATDGTHLIRVIDDHGRVTERNVEVQFTH